MMNIFLILLAVVIIGTLFFFYFKKKKVVHTSTGVPTDEDDNIDDNVKPVKPPKV